MTINMFDLIVIITLLGYVLAGYITGFIVQLARVFSLVAAFWAMGRWTDSLAPYLSFIESASWRPVAAAVIIFFATLLLAGILARLLKKIVIFSHAGWLDKLLGALAALAVGLIVWILIFMVLEYFFPQAEFIRSSSLAPYFNKIIDLLRQWFPQDALKFRGVG